MDKAQAEKAIRSVLVNVLAEVPHPTKATGNMAIGSPRLIRVDSPNKVYFVQLQCVESATATPKESMPEFESKSAQYKWLAAQAEKREAIAALKASI